MNETVESLMKALRDPMLPLLELQVSTSVIRLVTLLDGHRSQVDFTEKIVERVKLSGVRQKYGQGKKRSKNNSQRIAA